MKKRSESIKKQLVQIKYTLGVLLLAILVVLVFYFKEGVVMMPQKAEDSRENVQPSWSCPVTVWISCTTDEMKSKESCSEEYLSWVRANCPGFQGVVN